MLSVGQQFPEFSLSDQNDQKHDRSSLIGSKTIVYFYPKDDTSGCTTQACAFQESLPQFVGAKVFGVSPDGVKSHRKFADKYGLTFTLLADVETELSRACEVWVEKSMYGKKYLGIERTTFLLDEQGVITHIWTKVKPVGHAREVLDALR